MKIIAGNIRNMKEAVALSERVFKSGFLKENYMKELKFKPSNIRLLYEGEKPVSMACVLPRVMHLDGLNLKLAGIGGVATSSEYRGRGYAAEVMKETVYYMEKQGYGLSLLYPYKSEFYKQFGYWNITFPFKVIDTAVIARPACKYEIRKLTKQDYAGLKRVYDSFNRNTSGTIARPLAYWKNYCEYWVDQAKKMCWREDPFFCAYEKGRMIAYTRISSIRKIWEAKDYSLKISEFACLPGYEKAFECLLYACRRHAEKFGFKKLYFEDVKGINIPASRMPEGPEKRQYMNLKHVKMYRICDFTVLMRVLGRLFSRRLKQAGLSGSWHRFVSVKRCVKDSKASVLICSKASKQKMFLKEGEFVKLVLGLKTVQKDRYLRVFFPLLKPVFWDFDYL